MKKIVTPPPPPVGCGTASSSKTRALRHNQHQQLTISDFLRKVKIPALIFTLLLTWPVVSLVLLISSPVLIGLFVLRLSYGIGEGVSWDVMRYIKLSKKIVWFLIQRVMMIPTILSFAWYNLVTARADKSVRFDVPFAEYVNPALDELPHTVAPITTNALTPSSTIVSPQPLARDHSSRSLREQLLSAPVLTPKAGGEKNSSPTILGNASGSGGSLLNLPTAAAFPPTTGGDSNSSFGGRSATSTAGGGGNIHAGVSSYTEEGLSKTTNPFTAECRLDVLMSPSLDVSKLRPVIIFVYGGTWSSGSKMYYTKTCNVIRKATDCIVVVPDYPKWPNVTIPAMVDTIYHVVRWAHRNISRFGGDPNSLHLVGHSAGSQIVTQLVLQRALALSYNHPLPLPKACFKRSKYHTHPVPLFSMTSLKATEEVLDPADYSGMMMTPQEKASYRKAQEEKQRGVSPTEHLDYYAQIEEAEKRKRMISSDLDYRKLPPILSLTLCGSCTDMAYQLAFERAWGGDRISTLEAACRGMYTLNSPNLILNSLPAPPVGLLAGGGSQSNNNNSNNKNAAAATTGDSAHHHHSGGNNPSGASPIYAESVSSVTSASSQTTPRTRELARLHLPDPTLMSLSAQSTGLNAYHLPTQISVVHGINDELVDINQALMFRDALQRQIGPTQIEKRFSIKQVPCDHFSLVLGPVRHSKLAGMHPMVSSIASVVHTACSLANGENLENSSEQQLN